MSAVVPPGAENLAVADYCAPGTWHVLEATRAQLAAAGGNLGHGVEHSFHHAVLAAQRWTHLTPGARLVQVEFEPGNMTRYNLLVAELSPSAALTWGGSVAISRVGGLEHGASVACDLMDYFHPTFPERYLGLGYADAVLVGEFLSLFGSAVRHIEARSS